MADEALKLVNGIPRSRPVTATAGVALYDETLNVGSGGLSPNDLVTLPNNEKYDSSDLKVFLNGFYLEVGVDFNYVGTAPDRTQIEILRDDIVEGDKLRFRGTIPDVQIYDETVVIGAGGLSAGSNVTLPNSETYNDIDLQVYLDGTFLEPLVDYNYVGSIPRTEIQLAVELLESERLRFRIDP